MKGSTDPMMPSHRQPPATPQTDFHDDLEVVQRFRAGDRDAGNQLALMLIPLIGCVVGRVLGPGRSSDWEDACQAVWIRVLERLHTWRAECPLRGWVAVVAGRRALDIRQKRWPLTLPGDILAEFPKTKPETDSVLAECIRLTMESFPADRRQVLDLDLDGVRHDEIAQRMGKSRRTIQYWLESMRNAMLRCVE